MNLYENPNLQRTFINKVCQQKTLRPAMAWSRSLPKSLQTQRATTTTSHDKRLRHPFWAKLNSFNQTLFIQEFSFQDFKHDGLQGARKTTKNSASNIYLHLEKTSLKRLPSKINTAKTKPRLTFWEGHPQHTETPPETCELHSFSLQDSFGSSPLAQFGSSHLQRRRWKHRPKVPSTCKSFGKSWKSFLVIFVAQKWYALGLRKQPQPIEVTEDEHRPCHNPVILRVLVSWHLQINLQYDLVLVAWQLEIDLFRETDDADFKGRHLLQKLAALDIATYKQLTPSEIGRLRS